MLQEVHALHLIVGLIASPFAGSKQMQGIAKKTDLGLPGTKQLVVQWL